MSRSTTPPPVTSVVDAAGSWLPTRIAAVESRLAELVDGHGGLSTEARETLDAGGKRMRPLLVLVCAGPAAGGEAIRGATAIELVHMATLVHDDVLDAAPLRRGSPTVFARSGREAAVCTGDLLFALAFAELAVDGGGHQVSQLSAASVSLALGELAQRADAFDLSVDEARYERRCLLKTAALFECACAIGSPPEQTGALASFGRRIGLAFQMLDDVLDVVGPPERTGKARGTDLLDGTVNLPLMLAAAADPGLRGLDLRALDAAAAEQVCDRIVELGATAAVRERARALIDAAKDELSPAAIDGERRALLELVADGVVERYS